MPLCASNGPVLGRCWQHRPRTGPVVYHMMQINYNEWVKRNSDTSHCLAIGPIWRMAPRVLEETNTYNLKSNTYYFKSRTYDFKSRTYDFKK